MKAAIEILENAIARMEWDGQEGTLADKHKRNLAHYEQAIRVLEAAGKVDRENALWQVEEAFSHGREHVEMMAPYRPDHNPERYKEAEMQIRALLEALPEEEK